MAESLSLAAMTIDGGYADTVCAMTSSHFCSAERQFRLPLEYGGQRTPTAQWTVTGAGALLLTGEGEGPYVTHVTTGRIRDAGVTDANNMGAAMAPAAYETLRAHFADTGRTPADYAAIITGDLGKIGHEILTDLFLRDGVDLGVCSTDCGMLIFNPETQDVHAGGSGCGCSASVLCGHILQRMTCGDWPRVLFAATGALMSPTTSQQGEASPASVMPWCWMLIGGRTMWTDYLKAFLVGGALCALGQVLIDRTKLTPARILTCYVVLGVVLHAVGVYAPLIEWAGAGASVPLTGFGSTLAKGVEKAVAEKGFLGAFTGGLTASAGGIAAAIFFGYLAAVLFKPKEKK